jgi:hypothetical protein
MPLIDRELLGHPQRLPAGKDGDLGHRVPMGGDGRDQGMAGLMDGHRPLLIRQQALELSRRPSKDPVAGLGEVIGADHVPAGPDGEDGCLVDQVGQIGPGEAGGATGDHVQLHVGAELLAADVDLEDGPPFGLGWRG